MPTNKYMYMMARNELKSLETTYQKFMLLNEREKAVNFYLLDLKSKEYVNTYEKYLPALPVEKVLKNIMSRPLYSMLRLLPKGGNLHMHEPEMLDRRVFLNLIQQDPELYDMLYICDKENKTQCAARVSNSSVCNCSSYSLSYFSKEPALGWTKVRILLTWLWARVYSKISEYKNEVLT